MNPISLSLIELLCFHQPNYHNAYCHQGVLDYFLHKKVLMLRVFQNIYGIGKISLYKDISNTLILLCRIDKDAIPTENKAFLNIKLNQKHS